MRWASIKSAGRGTSKKIFANRLNQNVRKDMLLSIHQLGYVYRELGHNFLNDTFRDSLNSR